MRAFSFLELAIPAQGGVWTAIPGGYKCGYNMYPAENVPALGDRPLGEIQPPVIRKVERWNAVDVAARDLQFCTSIFRYAIQTGRVKFNPPAELAGALKYPGATISAFAQGDLPEFFIKLRERLSNIVNVNRSDTPAPR